MNTRSEQMAREQEAKAQQQEIRRALDNMGVQFKSETEPGGSCDSTAKQGCAVARPSPRVLIEDRIQYHNRKANQLCALLRSMPQEMSYDAESALAELVHESRPRY